MNIYIPIGSVNYDYVCFPLEAAERAEQVGDTHPCILDRNRHYTCKCDYV